MGQIWRTCFLISYIFKKDWLQSGPHAQQATSLRSTELVWFFRLRSAKEKIRDIQCPTDRSTGANKRDRGQIETPLPHFLPNLHSPKTITGRSKVAEYWSLNNILMLSTVWDGRLWKRFCKIFSESSTGRWAVLQLQCCPSKQGEISENI